MKMDQTEKLILEAIDQHRDEIIEFARDIYDHGELGYKEFNTAEKFIKKMKELGLRTETGLAITGTKAPVLLLQFFTQKSPAGCGFVLYYKMSNNAMEEHDYAFTGH